MFIILFTALFLSNVMAYTSNKSMPIIKLTFDEPISLSSIEAEVKCADQDGMCYEVSQNNIVLFRNNGIEVNLEQTNIVNDTVIYQLGFLFNDEYSFTTTVEDRFGNSYTYDFVFTVNADMINIDIIEPENGWSSTQDFDVVLSPDYISDCVYRPEHDNIPSNQNPPFLFDENYTISDRIFYKIVNASVNLESYINNNVLKLYVKCLNEDTGKSALEKLWIYRDTSAPEVEYEAIPNPLTDLSLKESIVYVRTPNLQGDNIGCEIKTLFYDGEAVNYPYESFHNIDFNDIITYNQENNYTLDFSDIYNDPQIIYEPHYFSYLIKCKNKAGIYASDEGQILNVTVQYSPNFNIEQIFPEYKEYVNENSVTLEIKTQVKTYWCNISDDDFNEGMDKTDPTDQRNYNYEFQNLDEGMHSYDVQCYSQFGSYGNEEIKFGVDKTAPHNLSIETNDYSCSLDDINFIMSAEDERSGIDYYNYTIKDNQGDIIDEGESHSGEVEYNGDLNENKTYKISGEAYDNAGNSATFSTVSITASDDDLIECDANDPNIIFDIMSEFGETVVNVTCVDVDSGCANNFDYGQLTGNQTDCVYDQLGTWANNKYSFILYEDTKLCIRAYDNNNNNKTIKKIITVNQQTTAPYHCDNNVTDSDETGIDCGGSECMPCQLGEDCNNNSDCQSDWCYNGICTESSCLDEITNGDESDIDCGGSCDPCPLNKSCLSNEDCQSFWCDSNMCKQPSCSDGITNGDESDIDCGGSCDPCPNGFDCIENSDCQSGNCNYGVCEDDTTYQQTTPGDDETKEVNSIAVILLILGLLLVAGGSGYLVYYSKTQKKLDPKQNLSFAQASMQQKPTLTKEQVEAIRKKREMMKDRFKIKSQLSKDKISSSLSPFDEFDSDEVKVKKVEEKLGKDAMIEKKKKEKKSGPMKKLDDGLKEDFVELNDINKKADEIKKDKKSDNTKVGKYVFDELDKIKSKNDKKANKKKEDTKNVGEVKENNKNNYISEEDFKKLDGLIDKELTKSKSKQDNKNNDNNKDNTIKSDNLKQQIKKDKDDVFAALNQIVKKSQKESDVSDNTKTFGSDEIIDMFKDNEIDINVFKVILSELLRTKKLNKKDISNIVFKLLEQDLIKKDIANQILEDLDLVDKS